MLREAMAILAAVAWGAGCSSPGVFFCAGSQHCDDQGELGRCEPTGYCSFPDVECESGYRYGTHASDLAGMCVAPEAGTSGAASGTDTATGTTEGGEASAGPAPDDSTSGTTGDPTLTSGSEGDVSETATSSETSTSSTDPSAGDESSGGFQPYGCDGLGNATAMVPATFAACSDHVTLDPAVCAMHAGAGYVSVDSSLTGQGDQSTAFLIFEPHPALQDAIIESVHLRLRVGMESGAGGPASGEVWSVDAFEPEDLNGAQPARIGSEPLATSIGPINLGQQVEWALPASILDSAIHLGIFAVDTNGIDYADHTQSNPPQLIITCTD